jgi:hypothetical protein
MAIKTFAVGEVLTASDTNTYLNNGGLVYVTQATATAGNTSVTIDNCFTSTYENYRIMWKFATPNSGNPAVYLQMRKSGATDATSNYYHIGTGQATDGSSANYNGSNLTSIYAGGLPGFTTLDIISPKNSATQTLFSGATIFYSGSAFFQRSLGGWMNVIDSMDGFIVSNPTFTADFTVYVYGYRKA